MDKKPSQKSQSNVLRFVGVCCALFSIQLGFGAYGVLYTKLAKGAKTAPLIFCFYRDSGCAPVLFLAAYVAEKRIQFIKDGW